MHGSRNFRHRGGVGVGGREPCSADTFENFFIDNFYYILILNLFSVILSFIRETIILKGYREGLTFSKGRRGVTFFRGSGGQMLISIETF